MPRLKKMHIILTLFILVTNVPYFTGKNNHLRSLITINFHQFNSISFFDATFANFLYLSHIFEISKQKKLNLAKFVQIQPKSKLVTIMSSCPGKIKHIIIFSDKKLGKSRLVVCKTRFYLF